MSLETLISKSQYRHFEAGEFIEAEERTCDQTIAMIEGFPWDAERLKIEVALTNPSVTIEGRNGDYLKLAIFYNGRFVLHYLDSKAVLFSKSFARYQDAYPLIRSFFQLATFDSSAFKTENTFLQNNRKHFESRDFNYAVSTASAVRFLLLTSGLPLGFLAFVIVFLLVGGAGRLGEAGMLMSAIIILLLVGPNLILFFNYYFTAQGKILILSKGNHIFYYGDRLSPLRYDKKDIRQVTSVRIRQNTRNPATGFAVIKLEFKDGTVIKIPDIFVGYIDLENKFSDFRIVAHNAYPFLRRKA